MKTIITTTILIITFGNICLSQNWNSLDNSPVASWRHDDIFFINPDTGWVVNIDGKIYKTIDGGDSWNTLINGSKTSFRCVGFVNAQQGWVGNLGPDNFAPTTGHHSFVSNQ